MNYLPTLLLPLPLLLLCAGAAGDVEVDCQVFDSTLVCDSDKERMHRAEVRTCSG